jgi:hypothetical protein
VTRVTFVLFLPDGRCGLVRGPDGRVDLPTGEVLPDEDAVDAVLRIPLATAGFRSRRFEPFRWSGLHLFAWVEGDHDGRLEVVAPEEAAARLRAQGNAAQAAVVMAAARSWRERRSA